MDAARTKDKETNPNENSRRLYASKDGNKKGKWVMCEITRRRKQDKTDVLDIKIMGKSEKIITVYPEEGL